MQKYHYVLCKRWDHRPEIDAGSIANTVLRFEVSSVYAVRSTEYMTKTYADTLRDCHTVAG